MNNWIDTTLSIVAEVRLSNVDKKYNLDEIEVRLCNYMDVYRNQYIDSNKVKDFMIGSCNNNELENFKLRQGQVAITKDSEKRDDIGISTYIAEDLNDVVLGYHTSLITPKAEALSGKFLNYWFNTKFAKVYFENNAGGSGQRCTLPIDIIKSIPLRLPAVELQERIASVFYNIDSKIELNNRINAELESMAKTIYDYWFVQFDFPDKNGKPYKTSGGKMVWNEELKREIPEGWEVNRFGEVVIIKNGKDHKHLKSGSFPVYGSGGVMRYVNEYLYDSESILIPRKGSLGNLFYLNQPFWSVDTIFYTQMKFAHSCKYLFYTTQNFNISKMNTGTAVPSMTAGILNNLSLVFPSEDILKRFDDILNPIFKNKDVLIKESEELTSLRDWLLPMLMNGQVRVS